MVDAVTKQHRMVVLMVRRDLSAGRTQAKTLDFRDGGAASSAWLTAWTSTSFSEAISIALRCSEAKVEIWCGGREAKDFKAARRPKMTC